MYTFFQVFGNIQPPDALDRFGGYQEGPGKLLQLIMTLIIMAGGIYALFNFLLAGYGFLGAGDNPKNVEAAWAKIYQTIIGLVFLVGAFLIAAIIGILVYGDPGALLNPSIPTQI